MPSQIVKTRFLEQTKELFFERIWSERDRKELLIQAFFPQHRWLVRQIDIEGAPDIFWTNCIGILIQLDCLLIDNLLQVLYQSEGEQTRRQIHALQTDLPVLCAETERLEWIPKAAVPLDPTDRQQPLPPTIYLSYSDEEAAFAHDFQAQLSQSGRLCWPWRAAAKGGDDWLATTTDGLNNSYALLLLVGPYTHQDRWVQLELLAARDKQKPIIPLYLGTYEAPGVLPPAVTPVRWAGAIESLLSQLPSPSQTVATEATWLTEEPDLHQRLAELLYMDRLKMAELKHVAQYTQLSGESKLRRTESGRLALDPVVARHEFTHAPWRQSQETEMAHDETRHFEDAVAELQAIGRAVLLGDPGSGKTTTLYKLAADLIDTALLDKTAPIPLMVRLGSWTEAEQPILTFLQQQAGELGATLPQRLHHNQVILLLDGLNEIPAAQHEAKYRQLNSFLAQYPAVQAIVSCRQQDYPPDRQLTLDTVTVAPLDPVRVYEFAHNYLGQQGDSSLGDDLFWKLAGKAAQDTFTRFKQDLGTKLPDSFSTFWLAQQLPEDMKFGYNNGEWVRWVKERSHPASLLLLAYNPYMLFMLVDVYQAYSYTLPVNRGQLFDRFVETLLVRERLLGRDPVTREVLAQPEGMQLHNNLTELAYEMQRQRQGREAAALTALPLSAVNRWLSPAQQYQAASANLLDLGETVRFSHQLLQEYFVARAMHLRIFNGLQAEKIWPPDQWWRPTDWEEATILLAGLYSDDCTPVLTWIAEANPELAARCIVESGAATPDATKHQLRQQWLPRLTQDAHLQARAAVGRALGRVTLASGEPLDNRSGVGFILQKGMPLPDIVWGQSIPAGTYTIGGDRNPYSSFEKRQVTIAAPYQLAIYPVTFRQFHCFVEALDWADPRWWAGMPVAEEAYGTRYQLQEWSEQAFPFANHPRERVSWYQAIAFCRWLSHKLGYEVDLPHEYEWEVAARYPDNRLYPWGNKFKAHRCNTDEGGMGQTTAVGLYLTGVQTQLGLYDLSGNVWEWCRNKYDEPEETAVDDSGALRLVRGGSWFISQYDARAVFRYRNHPDYRNNHGGFRLVRRPPSQ